MNLRHLFLILGLFMIVTIPQAHAFWNASNNATFYLKEDTNAKDEITGIVGIDQAGITYSTAVKQVGNASRLGSTTNRMTNYPSSSFSAFNCGTGGFTNAFWMKIGSGLTAGIISKNDESKWSVEYAGTDSGTPHTIRIYMGTPRVALSTSAPDDNVWHHIAWGRNASDNYVYFWFDGVRQGTPVSSTYNITNALNMTIGDSYGAQPYVGYLDEVYFSCNSPTQDVVNFLYANGTYPDSAPATYQIQGVVSYNSTAFAGANVTLLTDYGAGFSAKTTTNSSGGYLFTGLTVNTYYPLISVYRNATALLSSSSYVYTNVSVTTQNLDFYSSGTSTTTTYDLGCSCVAYNTGVQIFNLNNGCYQVNSLS